MWDLIGKLLIGLLAFVATGAALVGYVLWRRRRRMDDALREAAAEDQAGPPDQQTKGSGGTGPWRPR